MATFDARRLLQDSYAFTITLANLVPDANRLQGQQGAAIRNDQAAPLEQHPDLGIGGFFTAGAGATANGLIEVWMAGTVAQPAPGPIWPRDFDGTDSLITLESTEHKWTSLHQVARLPVNGPGLHSFKVISLESVFGNFIPHRFAPFVTQSTGANLENNATAHGLYLTPMRWQSVELP